MQSLDFTRALSSRSGVPLLADGALGSLLRARFPRHSIIWSGLPYAVEALNLAEPSAVSDVHSAYLHSGTRVFRTNTFCADSRVLAEHGLRGRSREITLAAVRVLREAIDAAVPGDQCWLTGSLGPSFISPEELHHQPGTVATVYADQIEGLLSSGVDALWIETARNALHTRLLLEAIVMTQPRLGTSVPIILTLSPSSRGRFPEQFTPHDLRSLVADFNLSAVGINCGYGVFEDEPILDQLASITSLPLIVAPCAGLPVLHADTAVYSTTSEQFAARMMGIVQQYRPAIIGGCCGTTPEHIRALHTILHPGKGSSSGSPSRTREMR